MSTKQASVRTTTRRIPWLLPLAATVSLLGGAWAWALLRVEPAAPAAARFVDEATCRSCHTAEFEAWQRSDHRRAMQPADEATVLGDFDERTLSSDVERSRFFRRDGGFWIHTPGADGQPADFPVAYTFGVDPLQQYLLRLPDGRLQAHGAAWDVDAGRWSHLYDGGAVDHGHRLHWTGAQQNADFMCAECHTTGFRRAYDLVENTWASTWHAPGVGCQSCHGAAERHLQWAEGKGGSDDHGFGAAAPRDLGTCAACHSRRTPIGNGTAPGEDLLDAYVPVLLTADLYEVDGKILGEVFEYGSFRQSRMHAAGVACADCHDPHSAGLRAPGNAVCTQCHNPAAKPIRGGIDGSALQAKDYDHPSHHRHAAGTPGSACVDCHMPGKVYMGNDRRRDHGFTSPNPQQAIELSHTDACLACHQHEADSTVAAFASWFPAAVPRDGGYARDLHAARNGLPGAAAALHRQLARTDLPDIRRATLLSELPNYPSGRAQRALADALRDPSPLVRRTAAELLETLFSPADRARLLGGMLDEPIRAVRLSAAWQMLQLPPAPGEDPQHRLRLIAEYEQVQHSMLDRAEAHFNLAGVYERTGRTSQVAPSLRRALRQDPTFAPAVVLLAQWLEQAENDAQAAARLLEDAIARDPKEASLWHALGLMRVRRGERDAAREALRRAHELAPDDPELGYALAAALNDGGDAEAALEILRTSSRRHPANRVLRQALTAQLHAAGLHAEAETAWSELAAQNPDDPLLRRRRRTEPDR